MKRSTLILQCVLSLLAAVFIIISTLFMLFIFLFTNTWIPTALIGILIPPALLPLIWSKHKKYFLMGYGTHILCFILLLGIQYGTQYYNKAITIDTNPNINPYEYLPFDENSKIVKIDSQLLSFEDLPKEELPIIDGATAAFPVYSAFVNAVYPHTTELYDGVFEYNNTVGGYEALAKRQTDIFIGAYPSKEQIATAENWGTTFQYTQIGSEAFVFFVHKNNPIESLTVEQIQGIYAGTITTWSQVGGKDEEIVPFQRNEGSGSQSMLIRIMGDTPIMEPNMETEVDGMGGIITEVADYKNKTSSIGFSFRFYLEGMIKNPNIKMIAVEGVAPTKENIQNGTYPFIAPVYAVTYEGNTNENVYKLIDWMLSEEGQYIIEETGYVGIGKQ